MVGVIGGTVMLVGLGWLLVLRSLDPGPHIAALDGLAVPLSWELVRTNVVEQVVMGSRVERYYLVDADPDQLVTPVTDMFAGAGFTLDTWKAPRDWCDTRPLRSTPTLDCPTKLIPPCRENGPGGPVTCYLSAIRGQECIGVVAFDRGEAASFAGGSVRDPGTGGVVRSVVRLTDYYGGGLTCPGLR